MSNRIIAGALAVVLVMQMATLANSNARRLPVSACEYELSKYERRAVSEMRGTAPVDGM